MRFGILGPLEVTVGERPVALTRHKERAVLAVLLLDANRVVSLERLVDQLWGGEPPAKAVGSLHAYISNLRRLIEPDRPPRAPAEVLVSRPPGYALVVDPDDVDALRFERLASEGRKSLDAGDPADAHEILSEALALWRGPALSDFAHDDFAAVPSRRLDELHAAAADDRNEAELALGRHDKLVGELEAVVAGHPLRERPWAQLMVALYRSGRQADALTAYRRARDELAELGIEPGPSLQRLERAILTQSAELDLAAPPNAPKPPTTAPAVPAQRAPSDTRSPLHGREPQLAVAAQAIATVGASRGQVLLLLTGEAGVGKTSLATEVLRRAAQAGFATTAGRCPEGEGAPPLWPWQQIVRGLSGTGGEPGELDELLPTDEAASAPPGRLYAVVLRFLRRTAAIRPVAVLLDDVQWADEASHRLLQLAVDDLADARVLFVVTHRSPTNDGTLSLVDTLSTLHRADNVRQLPLTGLDECALAAVIGDTAGRPAPAQVVRRIYERTGGNPFYAVQLAALLAAEHALDDEEQMAAAGVPSGVDAVVRRRLARLPDQAGAVLSVAAVVGPDVDLKVVQQMTGVGVEELLDIVELATVAGVLAERGDRPGVYRFSHDLVREAVYEALPGPRRTRLHQRAADAIVAAYGDDHPAHVHELAAHTLRAVPVVGAAPAVLALLASSRRAQWELALEQSERQLRRALDVLPQVPNRDRPRLEAQVQSRLASVAFHLRGDVAEAAARNRRAREMLDVEGASVDPELRAHVLLGIGTINALWGGIDDSLSAGREVLELGAKTGRGSIVSDGGYVQVFLAWQGKAAEACDHLVTSLRIDDELARAGGEPGPPRLSTVPTPIKRAALSLVLTLLGDPAAGPTATQAIEESRHFEWALAWVGAIAGVALALQGDVPGVLTLARLVEKEASGLAYTDAVLRACAGWAAARGGAPDLGLTTIDEARAALDRAGDGLFHVPLAALHAEALAERDPEGARALAEATRYYAIDNGQPGWLPVIDRAAAG